MFLSTVSIYTQNLTVTGERALLEEKVSLIFNFNSINCQAEFYIVPGKLADEFVSFSVSLF